MSPAKDIMVEVIRLINIKIRAREERDIKFNYWMGGCYPELDIIRKIKRPKFSQDPWVTFVVVGVKNDGRFCLYFRDASEIVAKDFCLDPEDPDWYFREYDLTDLTTDIEQLIDQLFIALEKIQNEDSTENTYTDD